MSKSHYVYVNARIASLKDQLLFPEKDPYERLLALLDYFGLAQCEFSFLLFPFRIVHCKYEIKRQYLRNNGSEMNENELNFFVEELIKEQFKKDLKKEEKEQLFLYLKEGAKQLFFQGDVLGMEKKVEEGAGKIRTILQKREVPDLSDSNRRNLFSKAYTITFLEDRIGAGENA